MQDRWLGLWRRLRADGDALNVYEDLAMRHGEAHRAYHNFTHIAQCLAEFDAARELAAEPDAVELAIWFHDAIYDPRAKDNEERSARLAETTALAAGLPAGMASRVTGLILATRHVSPPGDGDAALLVDADLSILGQSPERFDEYERQIRKEYHWVENKAFATGRAAILDSFLKRQHIYSTKFFQTKYEATARSNLARSLARLLSRAHLDGTAAEV